MYSLRALIIVVERILLQFDHGKAFLNGIYNVKLGCDRYGCLCTPCNALPLILPQRATHILKGRILKLLLVALTGPLGLRGPMLHQWIAKLRESITHLHSIHIVGDTIYSQIVVMVRNTRVTINLIFDRRIRALLRVMVLADTPSTHEQIALRICPREVTHCVSQILRRGAIHQGATGGVCRLAIYIIAKLVVPLH